MGLHRRPRPCRRSSAEEIGGRRLFITVTHHHGDHTGMLPAFKDDPKVTFWIQTDEFKDREIFPAERTMPIAGNSALDLGGGFVVDALELPGHTDHSTAFFLRGKNLLFSGDAIGSGGGVWIFSAEGFAQYRRSVDRLIAYIRSPDHGIDESKLVIFGGHYWQKREKEKLTMQYILDMQKLIGEIEGRHGPRGAGDIRPLPRPEFHLGRGDHHLEQGGRRAIQTGITGAEQRFGQTLRAWSCTYPDPSRLNLRDRSQSARVRTDVFARPPGLTASSGGVLRPLRVSRSESARLEAEPRASRPPPASATA